MFVGVDGAIRVEDEDSGFAEMRGLTIVDRRQNEEPPVPGVVFGEPIRHRQIWKPPPRHDFVATFCGFHADSDSFADIDIRELAQPLDQLAQLAATYGAVNSSIVPDQCEAPAFTGFEVYIIGGPQITKGR